MILTVSATYNPVRTKESTVQSRTAFTEAPCCMGQAAVSPSFSAAVFPLPCSQRIKLIMYLRTTGNGKLHQILLFQNENNLIRKKIKRTQLHNYLAKIV